MEQTLVAYCLDEPAPAERIEARLERVADHYGVVGRQGWSGDRSGAIIWDAGAGSCRWPAYSSDDDLEVVTAYVPTGWERLVGDSAPDRAALELGRALSRDPSAAAELDPPFVLIVRDRSGDELIIVNDAVGVARLYEMRFEGGWVWSNRLGALPLFAGVAPSADPRGWALLAGLGWFATDRTPILGAAKVRGSTAIFAGERGRRTLRTQAIERLVAGASDRQLRDHVADAAGQIRDLARSVTGLWPEPPTIQLSGGRDSRVGAAAAVAEGIPARFLTLSEYPGEVAVAEELLAGVEGRFSHVVEAFGDPSASGDVRSRARAVHLVYDGLPNTHILRWPLVGPSPAPRSALVSGHGGEVAHGFYYSSERAYRRVRRRGEEGLVRRLERAARRGHSAGRENAYQVVLEECERVLAEGRMLGLDGPSLLDYFYLVDRFANWGELGRHSMNCSPFATPAFIRAAFALTPEQRFDDVLHRELIERLAPEWAKVPFFGRERARLPAIVRPWLWETSDAEVVEEVVRDEALWDELFRPAPIREMWRRARAGEGAAHYEHIFERLVWWVTYEEHLRLLGARATAGTRGQPVRL
jgi:hypothetical protein